MKLSFAVATCLLAFLAVNSTFAAVTIAPGNVYDNGKISYSSDASRPAYNDGVMCWAASAVNAIQYWQDTYYGYRDKGTTPPNGAVPGYSAPLGTDALAEYEYLLQNWSASSGYTYNAYSWWMQGGMYAPHSSSQLQDVSTGAFYNGVFGDTPPVYDKSAQYQDLSQASFYSTQLTTSMRATMPLAEQILPRAFSVQGQAVNLSVCKLDYTGQHAITCWGYETDDQGNLTGLILTDSDDKSFGAFMVSVKADTYFNGYREEDVVVLNTDHFGSWYSMNNYTIYDICFIDTPATAANPGATENGLSQVSREAERTTVQSIGTSVTESCTLDAAVSYQGDTLTIGGGKYAGTDSPAAIIFSTTENGDISVFSPAASSPLVHLKDGAMGLLYGDLKVKGGSGTTSGGVEAEGKLYIHGGDMSIQECVNRNNGGGGLHAADYVELRNAGNVSVSGNSAVPPREPKSPDEWWIFPMYGGGGMGSDDSLSIKSCGEVNITGNNISGLQVRGGGIFARERAYMDDNASVSLSRNKVESEYTMALGGGISGMYLELDRNGSVSVQGNSVSVDNNGTYTHYENNKYVYGAYAQGGGIALAFDGKRTSYLQPDGSFVYAQATMSMNGNNGVSVSENKVTALQSGTSYNSADNAYAMGGGLYLDHFDTNSYGTVGSIAEIRDNIGSVSFTGNIAEASTSIGANGYAYGGAAYIGNACRLVISGERQEVSFTGNSAVGSNTSRGGAVYNAGSLDMSGNGSILFTGNSAQEGNDIFNAAGALCNISSNGSVVFKADAPATGLSVAVQNEGDLYVSAATGHTVLFENTALSTAGEGKTYIGQDAALPAEDCSGQVLFTASSGAQTEVAAKSVDVPAIVQNLVLSAGLIARAGDSGYGSLDNTMVTALGELTMQHVSLNTTDAILAAGEDYISMNDVVITLNKGDLMEDNRTFDLTGMFRGNYNLDSVTFDLTDESLADLVPENLVFDMSTAYALPEFRKVNVLWNADPIPVAQVGMLVLAGAPIPEPATGTLGLLALAALATRRRRR